MIFIIQGFKFLVHISNQLLASQTRINLSRCKQRGSWFVRQTPYWLVLVSMRTHLFLLISEFPHELGLRTGDAPGISGFCIIPFCLYWRTYHCNVRFIPVYWYLFLDICLSAFQDSFSCWCFQQYIFVYERYPYTPHQKKQNKNKQKTKTTTKKKSNTPNKQPKKSHKTKRKNK